MDLQHHIQLGPRHLEGNRGIGRYVFLPGSQARAARIASRFEECETLENPRGYTAHLGYMTTSQRRRVAVLALATGVGSASTEVVVHELLACGARRLVRVGSCGTMAERVSAGDVILVTGAVRDEATTGHYAPAELPAMAHPRALAAMSEGARRARLGEVTFQGLCHSKASLYAREFGHGPAGDRNRQYAEWIRRCGVLATEMEASTLFILSMLANSQPSSLASAEEVAGCQAGCVLAVFASDHSDMKLDPERVDLAETRAIRIALEGVRVWAEWDRRTDDTRPTGEDPQPE